MEASVQFPKYDAYKESGVEWLGRIPEHWKLSSIRAVTELKGEKNQPDLSVLSVYREYGVIPKDSRDDNHNATSLDTSTYKAVKAGDLVVNKMKAWQGSMGVSEHEGIVSPAYITCKVKQEKMLPKYLHYLLRSKPFVGVYNSISYGVRVGQWDMRYEDFKKVAIVEPPAEEMKRIVLFIDHKTAEIDAAIAKKQELIQLLNEQKTILINRAVTKGLNPNIKMKDSGVAWIGEIPEHWIKKKVKHLSSFITSGPRGWSNYFGETGAYFLQSGNLNNSMGLLLEDAVKVKPPKGAEGVRTVLKNRDVLVCITGANTGRVALAEINNEEVYINQHLSLIRPTKLVIPEYLALCLHSALGKTYFFLQQYGLKEGLSLGDVKNCPAFLPPEEEQKQIIEYCAELSGSCDQTVKVEKEAIYQLNEFKQTLITHTTTGKIKV